MISQPRNGEEMFVVISKFTIDNKDHMTELVKKAFEERPHRVEDAAGFIRLDVLTPLENPRRNLAAHLLDRPIEFPRMVPHTFLPVGALPYPRRIAANQRSNRDALL